MLPTFPDFELLSLRHKDALQAIANKFPSYSDFNFVSLFTWDVDGKIMVSLLNNNLVVMFTDYLTHENVLSFLGDNKIDETIDKIMEYCQQKNLTLRMQYIPATVAEHVSDTVHEHYVVEEDPDNHDYILSVNDLVEFRTNKYTGKKSAHNHFVRNYGERATAKELDLDSEEVINQVRKVVLEWQKSRGKGDDETKEEFTAIRRCLDNHNELGVRAYGSYVDDELVAFTIFEIVHGQTAIIHYDKANVGFKGVFENLKHNFAKHLATIDIKYINYEQDLGIDGLRFAKSSWQPVDYLKKYVIRPRH